MMSLIKNKYSAIAPTGSNSKYKNINEQNRLDRPAEEAPHAYQFPTVDETGQKEKKKTGKSERGSPKAPKMFDQKDAAQMSPLDEPRQQGHHSGLHAPLLHFRRFHAESGQPQVTFFKKSISFGVHPRRQQLEQRV